MNEFINKIICGNCLEVLSKIPNESIDLIFTDPPYNLKKAEWDRNRGLVWYRLWLEECKRVLKRNGSFYITLPERFIKEFLIILDELLTRKKIITWFKPNQMAMNSRGWKCKTEFVLWYVKSSNWKFNILGDFNLEHDVWNIPLVYLGTNEGVEHPTQKPEKLLERIIKASSNEGDIILDPFLGSGTTAVVCKKLNRRFIGIEINPDYCRIAEERLRKVPKRLDKFVNKIPIPLEAMT